MFLYQQGDVMRLYSGDFIVGELELGEVMSAEMLWMISAITMTIPVVMIILSLTLPYKANRWANIIVAILFFIYNLSGVITSQYPSAYDIFLITVSLAVNVLTVWYAWKWSKQEV
jgi:lipopolysaccharide export LptBFGC system permease protein LptF